MVKSSRSEKGLRYKRKKASKVRHTKCVHHIGCSSEAASGEVVEFYSVRATWSSRSEKSSQYNRKRASRACHTKCVHHIGCSSKAAQDNVVKFHVYGVLNTRQYTLGVSRTFGGVGGLEIIP